MQHNRVDRVLYLVRDPASGAAAGRHLSRYFDFIVEAALRFRVVQRQQSTDRGSFFLNEIERDLHSFSVRGFDLTLGDGIPQLKTIEHQRSQRRVSGENLLYRPSEQFSPGAAQETLY